MLLGAGPVPSQIVEYAERLNHTFNLFLSANTALFRSDCPLLLDFSKPWNQDLLGGDADLIDQAMHLRALIMKFRQFSPAKVMRSTFWYQADMHNRLREVLDGRGLSK